MRARLPRRPMLAESLPTALAQQINHRVLATKYLVKEMDADTRAKLMSCGISIAINRVRSDTATDQKNTERQGWTASDT